MSRVQPKTQRHVGQPHRVAAPVALLCDERGSRQRELLLGAQYNVIEEKNGRAFGYAARDGYRGWIDADMLVQAPVPTHRIHVIRSYAKPSPALKVTEPIIGLSFGSAVTVTELSGDWAEIWRPQGKLFVPRQHLMDHAFIFKDPIAVAQQFLGTPYLWGGNSAFGIDCSGLVQAACHACGLHCPGDSDLQAGTLGTALDPATRLARGDLVFWRGHVAWVSDPETILHANAHSMNTCFEPLSVAKDRIAAAGGGGVTTCRRIIAPTLAKD